MANRWKLTQERIARIAKEHPEIYNEQYPRGENLCLYCASATEGWKDCSPTGEPFVVVPACKTCLVTLGETAYKLTFRERAKYLYREFEWDLQRAKRDGTTFLQIRAGHWKFVGKQSAIELLKKKLVALTQVVGALNGG